MQGRARHTLEALERGSEADSASATAVAPRPGGLSPAELQSEELLNSSAREGSDALDHARALIDGQAPNASDVVAALGACTAAERALLAADAAFVDTVVDRLPVESLPPVLQALFVEPRWMVYHYACRKGGADQTTLRHFIGLGTVEQRLDMIAFDPVATALVEAFADGEPDAILGPEVGRRLDGDPALSARIAACSPRFAGWRLRTGRLDLSALLGRLSQGSEALRAGMEGAPSPWAVVVGHAPRGAALDDVSRGHLDRIALEMTGALSVEQLRQAFEVRFGQAPAAEAGTVASRDQIKTMWAELARMSPGKVDAHAIRRVAFGSASAGDADWQGWMLGADADDPRAGKPDGEGERLRSDGGEVDAREAFERFAATSKAQWRRHRDLDAVLDELIRVAGGDDTLRAAARAFWESDGPEALVAWHAAVEDAATRGALVVSVENLAFALPNLKGGGGVVSNPRAEIAGRKFVGGPGAEFASYAVEGEDPAGISAAAYSGWPAFFSEIRARWRAGDRPGHAPGTNLPSWVAAQGFGRLVDDDRPEGEGPDPATG